MSPRLVLWRGTGPRANECGHNDRRHYAKGLCRQCYRTQPEFVTKRKEYYAANRHLWRAQNARVRSERRREAVRYGITTEQIAALAQDQGGRCAICHRPPGAKQLSVDHDHVTGAVRALLCSKCNTGLGLFREDPDLLAKAAVYLRRQSAMASLQRAMESNAV